MVSDSSVLVAPLSHNRRHPADMQNSLRELPFDTVPQSLLNGDGRQGPDEKDVVLVMVSRANLASYARSVPVGRESLRERA